MLCGLILLISLLLSACHSATELYLVWQLEWEFGSESFKCIGVPKLTYGTVDSIEKATSVYYSALMVGRFPEDKFLEPAVPPASILGADEYLNLIRKVIIERWERLGSRVMMINHCDLHNNKEWVKLMYNGPFSRNSVIVRATLDITYKIGMCLRGVDPEYNCPEVCRSVPVDFCTNKANTMGVCSSYLESFYRHLTVDYSDDDDVMMANLRKFLKVIPVERRMPLKFFTHIMDRKDFRLRVEMQMAVLRKAYCPCATFFTYDKQLDACIDMRSEIGCFHTNPCANGGQCTRVSISTDSGTVSEIKCLCPSAFRGERCELKYDRCAERNLCGRFQCIWDPYEYETGYRCKCPATHRRKNAVDPTCIPKPACGLVSEEDVSDFDVQLPSPCRYGGQCIQDLNDPTAYECVCPEGYTGRNCETPPPEAVWSNWGEWSECILPDISEICFQRPYRQKLRECVTFSQAHRCSGPRRQISYYGCDLNGESASEIYNTDRSRLDELISAIELCDYAGSRVRPAEESELDEPLMTLNHLDDWSLAGPETAPSEALDKLIHSMATTKRSVLPEAIDLLIIIGWVLLIPMHLAMLYCWIYHIHKWRQIIMFSRSATRFV